MDTSPLKKGETVYTILRSCSRSGMTRVIDLYVIRNNTPLRLVGILTDEQAKFLPPHTKQGAFGYKVKGCGMDMGFHIVYELSASIFGDGYALKQDWL